MESTQITYQQMSWYPPRMTGRNVARGVEPYVRAATIAFVLCSTPACGGNVADPAEARPASDGGAEGDAHDPSCTIPQQVETAFLKPNRLIGECPKPGPPCAYSPFSGPPLLTADELHSQARLVALSGDLVLADWPRADGSLESLVVRVPASGDTPFVILPFSEPLSPDVHVLDIDGHALLSCGGGDCRIDLVAPPEAMVEPTGAHPPIHTEPVGIVDWTFAGLVCVYGNGVQCFDGKGWLELVPADSGPRFNAAAATRTSIWAAGDAGRVVVATTDCWRELESGTKESLRSLSVDGSRELWAVAAGDSGALSYLGVDETISCSVGESTTLVLRTWGQNSGYMTADSFDDQWVFQTGGSTIQGKPSVGGDWCTTQIGDTVVDATWFTCGVAENKRIITAQALFGEHFCAVD